MNLNFRIPLRNARILACCLAMLAFGLLIPCQGAEDVVSDPVGMMRVAVPSNTCLMVAMPFDAVSNSINAVLQGQLCGASAESNADRMLMWNAVNQEYAIAFKADDTGDSQKDGYWFESGTNWVLSELTLSAGDGFWIDSRHAGQNLYLLGNVVLCPTQYVELEAGLNAVAFPFPAAFDLNGSSLAEDGALGGTNWSLADNFITGNDSNRFWLLSQAGHQWDGQWLTMSNQPVENAFELGKPFWYDRAAASGMTWSIIRPCGEPPVLGSNTPQIVDMSYNSTSQTVMLMLSCTSSVEALLEVFYQDLASTDSMTMASNWLSAAQDIAVTNQEAVTWIDNGSGDRCAVTQAFCRIYMAARQDIDTDSDALSDAFEQYVQQTDETVADTDQDGLNDGEEVLEEETDPLNPDTDADCMADGVELTWTQDPTSSNDYAQLPWTEDFEGMATGTVHQQNGWTADPQQGTLVQQDGYVSSTNSLKFIKDEQVMARHLFGAHGATNVWVDMWLYAQAGVLPDVTALTNNPWSALVAVNPDGRVCAYDGLMSEWQTVTNGVAVTGQWIRLTVGLNYQDRTWRLNGDNMLLLKDLGFFDYNNTVFACIDWLGSTLKSTYLDNVSITTEEPSHLDDDIDGIPNVWEKLYGLDPEDGSDALSDSDNDGLTNLWEWYYGSDPFSLDGDGDGMNDVDEIFWATSPLLSNTISFVPWSAGFEIAEGYVPGDLHEQQGWNVAVGSVEVQSSVVAQQTQSVKISRSSTGTYAYIDHFCLSTKNTSVWTVLNAQMMPQFRNINNNGLGRKTAIVYCNSEGRLTGFNGVDSQCVVAARSPAFPRHVWMNLAFQNDYENKTWSLYWEGRPVLENLGFADPAVSNMQRFAFIGGSINGEYLDDLGHSYSPPAILDQDSDGISDILEDLNGNGVVDAGESDYLQNDSDSDGVDDGRELEWSISSIVSNLYSGLPWSAGFEVAEGYSNSVLNQQPDSSGWIATTSVCVQGDTVYSGSWSAVLQADASMNYRLGGASHTQAWFDGYFRLNAGKLPYVDSLTHTGAVLIACNPNGLPCAYDDLKDEWIIPNSDWMGDAAQWCRITVRLDYNSRSWDFYLNGLSVEQNIPFLNSRSRHCSELRVINPEGTVGDAFADNLAVTIEEPPALDSDNDGLPNSWEREYGLDPYSAIDADNDADADMISNMDEYLAGLDPLSIDTDGDGISDYDEIYFCCTDPLVPEFTGSVVNVYELEGYETNSSLGYWGLWDGEIYSRGIRGELEYVLQVPEAGCYRIEIEGYNTYVSNARLIGYLDGHYLGVNYLINRSSRKGTAYFYTPWITNNTATLRFVWDNVYDASRLHVTYVRLQKMQGPDTDGDGIQDWVETCLNTVAGVQQLYVTSSVSPCCIEGKARFFDLMESPTASVQHGAGSKWFANIPLSTNEPVWSVLKFQNGIVQYTNTAVWSPHNVLLDGNLSVREGDSVMLTALPVDPGSGGTVTISAQGVFEQFPQGSSCIQQFDTAGCYQVVGIYSNSVSVYSNQINVNVIAGHFPTNNPAAWYRRWRTLNCPDMPSSNVVFESDDSMPLGTISPAEVGVDIDLMMDEVDSSHHLVARLSENGPILDSVKIHGFWAMANVDHVYHVVEILEDGSEVIENRLICCYLPDNVRLDFSFYIGGVVFEDGTVSKTLYNSDLGVVGEYIYRMILEPDKNSPCHTIEAYQNTDFIGRR